VVLRVCSFVGTVGLGFSDFSCFEVFWQYFGVFDACGFP